VEYNSPEGIKKILYRLVECSSLSGTIEEIDMAKEVYNIFHEMPYFQKNPQYLRLNPIQYDALGRSFVTALVKGKGDKTVVMINHMDIVDYDGFGAYKHLALNPEGLTSALDPSILPHEAKEDLLSGEWIFGRGLADMKCGGAMEAALIAEVSEAPENFDGNLLFLSVPDEENNSAGMIGAIPLLNSMKEEFGLNYVALINNEPHPVENEEHNLYIGSVGKVLPLFYCMGKETHAGQILEGLNADLLLADIQREMELNMDLVDKADGEYTYPPTALKVGDNKDLYNVSTPATAYAYYNVLTLQYSPKEIMDILKNVANRAFVNTIDKFRNTTDRYKELAGEEFTCPWEPKVYTYDEIYQLNLERIGSSFDEHMHSFIQENKATAEDERNFAIKVIGEVVRLCPDRDPKIVIAFAPPYYPHVRNKGETDIEKHMFTTVDKLKAFSKENFNVDWKVNKFYKQLSDMSYCGVQDAEDILEMLKPNMPNLGHTYFLPLEEMAKFNAPVLNLGPWGKDLHKFTERLHGNFAFEVAPKILKFAVMELLKG